MPLYSTFCLSCRVQDAVFRKISERDNVGNCPHCGKPVERLFDTPRIQADIEPYESPKTGKWITSRNARDEDLRASGSFMYEKGVEKDIQRNRLNAQERTFKPIADAVDSTVAALVSAGKLET